MTDKNTDNFSLITPELLESWRKEDTRLEINEKEIQKRRGALKRLIEAGASLMPVSSEPQKDDLLPPKRGPGRPRMNGHAPTIAKAPVEKTLRRMKENGWTGTMLRILEDKNRGMSYDEVKSEIMNTPLADKLRKTEKSFYGAIDKLSIKQLIFKHNGRLYSKIAYKVFQKAVAAGTAIDDQVPARGRKSGMADAIISFLATKPRGAISAEIIATLNNKEEFKQRITKNPSTPYNVISGLLKRDEIVREDGVYRLIPR